jgi:tRNA1Val (adenine37-N6)-methyltransferase
MERLDDLQFSGLKIFQDTEGFRFGIDSVLLTEFAKDIKKGSKIVDLGSGTSCS